MGCDSAEMGEAWSLVSLDTLRPRFCLRRAGVVGFRRLPAIPAAAKVFYRQRVDSRSSKILHHRRSSRGIGVFSRGRHDEVIYAEEPSKSEVLGE